MTIMCDMQKSVTDNNFMTVYCLLVLIFNKYSKMYLLLLRKGISVPTCKQPVFFFSFYCSWTHPEKKKHKKTLLKHNWMP